MDEIRIGRQIRALRRRRAWRQQDLAAACGTSRSSVGRLERGRVREVSLTVLGRVAAALGARLELRLSWNGEALDRLLDADHAALVERVARLLTSLGWAVAVEVSFNVRGERGSIDILAFHPPTGALLVTEIKSVVPDVQATIVVLDRKARLARDIARERGWRPTTVGRLLVIGASRTARRRVAQHRTTFESAFPDRGVAVRRWLVEPVGNPRFSGLMFLPMTARWPLVSGWPVPEAVARQGRCDALVPRRDRRSPGGRLAAARCRAITGRACGHWRPRRGSVRPPGEQVATGARCADARAGSRRGAADGGALPPGAGR